MITPERFLKLMDVEQEDVFRLGVVTETFTGKVKVRFDGESQTSGKKYLTVSYSAEVGDRVLLAKVKGTYLALGKIGG